MELLRALGRNATRTAVVAEGVSYRWDAAAYSDECERQAPNMADILYGI
jgi:hypothetical protein